MNVYNTIFALDKSIPIFDRNKFYDYFKEITTTYYPIKAIFSSVVLALL